MKRGSIMILNEDLFEPYEEDKVNIQDSALHPSQPKAQVATPIIDDSTIYVFEVAPDRESCPDTYRDELEAIEAAQCAGYDKMYKVGYTLKDGTYIPSGYEEVIEISVPVLESKMSDLDIEIQNAGGKDAWLEQAQETVDGIQNYIDLLTDDVDGPEKEEAIARQKAALDSLQSRIKVVENS